MCRRTRDHAASHAMQCDESEVRWMMDDENMRVEKIAYVSVRHGGQYSQRARSMKQCSTHSICHKYS